MPTFSIISATYNRPKLLERMISSVLHQTFTDWELIIIDDSTNEDTREYISKYKDESRITYLKNEKNSGVGFTRNRGLDIATGIWVTFLDDDDYYYDNTCLHQIAEDIRIYKQYPWLTYNTIDEKGIVITQSAPTPKEYSYVNNYLFGYGFRGDAVHVMKKQMIGITRIDEADRTAPEWQFFYELSEQVGNFFHIPKNIVVHEYTTDGLTKTKNFASERKVIRNKLKQLYRDGLLLRHGPIMVGRYLVNFKATHWIFMWYKKYTKKL